MAMLAPPTPAGGPDRFAPIAAVDRSASDNGASIAGQLLQVRHI